MNEGRVRIMGIGLDRPEADELRDLLELAVHAVIAEFLDTDIASFHPHARLGTELSLSPAAMKRLRTEIVFIFAIPEITVSDTVPLGDLVDQVAQFELSRLARDTPMRVA
jgi:hypothetical protein